MKQYTIRPYFGHDCNSWDGFNNGHYLDEIEVNASNEYEAIELAMSQFEKENANVSKWEKNGFFGENTFYIEFSHTEGNGNDIDPNDIDDNSCYLYQYISFECIEEVSK